MKRLLFLSALLLFMVSLTSHGQEMPRGLRAFRDVCVKAKDAYSKHDAGALSRCITVMDSLDEKEVFGELHCEPMQPGTEVAPDDFHFTPEWFDDQLMKWVAKDRYQPHMAHRGENILLYHVKILAHSTASFQLSGMGLISMVVIAHDDTDIQIGVEQPACNHHYQSGRTAKRGCQEHSWMALSDSSDIVLSITNPADHDIVCVIASN